MGRAKHRNKDRGENEAEVKNLRAAIFSTSKFLNSKSSDRNRGSFNDAVNKLKVVGVITVDDLKKIGLTDKQASATFSALGNPKAKGGNIVGLTSEQKRSLVQTGQTRAMEKGAQYGLRIAA